MRCVHPKLTAATTLLIALQSNSALAANAIQVGSIQLDRPTLCCLGLVVPLSGDDNYNATATVEYRMQGASTWKSGLPLLRVRPDTLGSESPPSDYGLPDPTPEFAGSIFDLVADTAYDVRISVTDPDGGSAILTTVASTRSMPLDGPAQPNVINVATGSALTNALANAQPGDVIQLSSGTYSGAFTLSRSGTEQNAIVLRGDASTVIDATGSTYALTVSGSHIYIEGLTLRGSNWAVRLSGAQNIVVRNTLMTAVNKGIDARNGSKRDFYICDNVLEGRLVWPNISNTTWNEEGIVVTGEGHVVCHNRLSGFGDALGLSQETSLPNRSIDFYGNDVLWSSDDGLEIDYAHRNIRVFRNRVTNSGMGVSVQPGWGGPIYFIRNVLVNQAHAPYKFNNDPTGILIFNNTSIRTNGPGNYAGWAWPQLGYTQANGSPAYVANFQFLNNIAIGASGPAQFTSDIKLGTIDSNGWYPDGPFTFFNSYANLADVKARSPYEAQGRILTNPTFAAGPALGPDYTTRVTDPEVTLQANANAVDTGRSLANVTEGFIGAAPDIGALERGAAAPTYGVRVSSTKVPRPPGNVQVD